MSITVLHAPSPAKRSPAVPVARLPSWRIQAAIVFGLQLGHLQFESVRSDHALLFNSLSDWIAFKSDEVMRQSLNVAAATVALHCLGLRPAARPYRGVPALLAMLLAAVVSAAGAAFLFPYEPVAVRVGASASVEVWFWYMLWAVTILNLFALVAIDGLHEQRQAAIQLATAQDRGRLVREQLASARLLAIQARVDPQLLFDMLAAVKRFYEEDVTRAERLLDDLSAFLRSALPRLRSARSTLQVEFDLARSYVRLLRDAGAASIELQIDLPPELASAGFPAGVLLPLLAGPAAEPRRIALHAAAKGAALCVCVCDSSAALAQTLEQLRGSLSSLYGERFDLQHRPLGSGAWMQLELPLEAA
ncbi:MAG TPA: histidine kinase [Rubrivivax sp.]|nr:histidine kinase [Rubrivivax sp.]